MGICYFAESSSKNDHQNTRSLPTAAKYENVEPGIYIFDMLENCLQFHPRLSEPGENVLGQQNVLKYENQGSLWLEVVYV